MSCKEIKVGRPRTELFVPCIKGKLLLFHIHIILYVGKVFKNQI